MKKFSVALVFIKDTEGGTSLNLRHMMVSGESKEAALGFCVNYCMNESKLKGFSLLQKSVFEITPAS